MGIGSYRLLISIRICNLKIQHITDRVVKLPPEVAARQDLDADQILRIVAYDVPAQESVGYDVVGYDVVGYDVPAQVVDGQVVAGQAHDVPDRAQVSAVGLPNGHATVLEDATC